MARKVFGMDGRSRPRPGGRKYAWNESHPRKVRNAAENAIRRCTDQSHKQYDSYGGRGINIYEPWVVNPLLFVEYLMTLHGWDNDKLVIDRINNDGNYEPNNLRWVDRVVSSRNQRKREWPHHYFINNGFAHSFKRLHDNKHTYDEIADLYCTTVKIIRNCLKKISMET